MSLNTEHQSETTVDQGGLCPFIYNEAGLERRVHDTQLLYSSIDSLRFVTAKREELFSKLKIKQRSQLLYNLPHRYLDLSCPKILALGSIGESETFIVRLHEVKEKRSSRRSIHITEAWFVDESAILKVVYFQQPWMAQSLKPGALYAVAGQMSFDGGFRSMQNPFVYQLEEEETRLSLPILPVHRATEGLSAPWIRRITAQALVDGGDLISVVPARLRAQKGLMSRARALKSLHFPKTMQEQEEARRSLSFEEQLCLNVALRLRRNNLEAGVQAYAHKVEGPCFQALQAALPFELSEEQSASLDCILEEMHAPRIMNHMLLGDVGTGKTAVASCALAVVGDNNTQAVCMAPTAVLAQQYALKIGPLLEAAGMSWALLTGATKQSDRAQILSELASGKLQVIMGTHALLEDEVQFKNLSLVVIDEQHRFGVAQRTRLRKKGPGADLLLMTATPIPRTLALSSYGDLSCTYLCKRPVAGAGITTHLVQKSERGVAYEAIAKAVRARHQAYIICPLIGSKKSDEVEDSELIFEDDPNKLKAAKKEAAFLSKKVFPEFVIEVLTGDMPAQKKDEIMDRFRRGMIQILVSTTVIEVGVDVPNATVMMIEDAHRFGLSQLHQLRGRVGRGKDAGEVYLVAPGNSPTSLKRLSILCNCSDGLKLAEEDLRMRGQGELMGRAQHGSGQFIFTDLIEDGAIIASAHECACEILEADPLLEAPSHAALRTEVLARYHDSFTQRAGG